MASRLARRRRDVADGQRRTRRGTNGTESFCWTSGARKWRSGFRLVSWYGLMAPAGTPTAVLDRVHQAMRTALLSDEVRNRMEGLGAEVAGSTPAEFAAELRAEFSMWADVIRTAKIKVSRLGLARREATIRLLAFSGRPTAGSPAAMCFHGRDRRPFGTSRSAAGLYVVITFRSIRCCRRNWPSCFRRTRRSGRSYCLCRRPNRPRRRCLLHRRGPSSRCYRRRPRRYPSCGSVRRARRAGSWPFRCRTFRCTP